MMVLLQSYLTQTYGDGIMKYKTIGIIGGMGARATVDLFQKIVINTYAGCDQDHIPILIDNNTQIPDRMKFLFENGRSPLDDLFLSASKLQKMGADFLLLACNTAHHFYKELSSIIDIPIINMVEETVKEVSNRGYKKIGLLGTKGFMKSGFYKSYYNAADIDVICPTDIEQEIITTLIKAVKAQENDIEKSLSFSFLERLSNNGVEAFVLSCTELPIAFSKWKKRNPLIKYYKTIDPNYVLAKKAIISAGGELNQCLGGDYG